MTTHRFLARVRDILRQAAKGIRVDDGLEWDRYVAEAITRAHQSEQDIVTAEYLIAPYGSVARPCKSCGRVYPVPADETGEPDEDAVLAAAMAHAVADETSHADILIAYRELT